MEFINKAPKWDAEGTEPSAELQANGFVAGYKPPAPYFNFLFHMYSACINELQGGLNTIDSRFYKKIVKADTTEAFFVAIMGELHETITTPQTITCGCTHDGKDYYFGTVYKNGSTMCGTFYGVLNKVGCYVTYNTTAKTVSIRNLPNENFAALVTNNKSNLVGAINEVYAALNGKYLYGNFDADNIADYLEQVCVFVCEQESGSYTYRGAWSGNSYYTGVFYRTSSFVYGTLCDHNGKEYYCNYTIESAAFVYKTLTVGDLAKLVTTDKSSVVSALNEISNTHNIKTYTNLSQIGLADGATMSQVARALPAGSVLRIYVLTSTNAKLAPTATNGWLEVHRPVANHALFRYMTTSRYTYNAVALSVNTDSEQISVWTQVANADEYLPLTGGTLEANNLRPLVLKNTADNASYTRYDGKDGILGFLGFSAAGKARILDAAGALLGDIYHTGNKPTLTDLGMKTENWTFTLEDGSTVTKKVVLG